MTTTPQPVTELLPPLVEPPASRVEEFASTLAVLVLCAIPAAAVALLLF